MLPWKNSCFKFGKLQQGRLEIFEVIFIIIMSDRDEKEIKEYKAGIAWNWRLKLKAEMYILHSLINTPRAEAN